MSKIDTKTADPGTDRRQDEVPYNAIPIPRRIDDRPTEDDLAQASLGGPKRNPAMPAAPLTKTEAEQNLPNDDPGHVA